MCECMHVSVISLCTCVCCVCMSKNIYVYVHTLIFDSLLYKCNKAVKLVWPGNDLPLFRANKSNQVKLSGLVNELKEMCTTKNSNKDSICEHILDSMHER